MGFHAGLCTVQADVRLDSGGGLPSLKTYRSMRAVRRFVALVQVATKALTLFSRFLASGDYVAVVTVATFEKGIA
jgi:hypothetical protein